MNAPERALDGAAGVLAAALICTPLALASTGLLLLSLVSGPLAVLAGMAFAAALIAAHLWLQK